MIVLNGAINFQCSLVCYAAFDKAEYCHCLFACFIDSVADKVKLSGVGCYVNLTCMSILLYADDILLVAPSVASLQRILSICEAELDWLDMRIVYSIWCSL